ncbi:hypothetical protein TL16_g07538 [Triparma laevis f. inornata]|uniref:Uncharacterized protein n=1 Tax=Triparma laevis f. inornata TaxID=1714386 RepID=A0A9W7AYG8_9STRA|nr:hypothetical protein TL16_g07538 [Triparma laevis f. inornata]
MITANGIQFSRTINSLADDSSLSLKFDAGCSSEDDYGSNDCSFGWGDTVSGNVNATLGHDLEDGSTFSVDLKLDKFISWSFSFAACGSNCTTSVPIVNQDVNFAMPDCPITADGVTQAFSQALPTDSPTKGVKVTAIGNIEVKDAAGDSVISMDIDATVQ